MTPIKSRPLIDQEIEELDAFLLSDDGLENAMDVSGLDGFLCDGNRSSKRIPTGSRPCISTAPKAAGTG